jgi:hypothetical protein
MVAKERDIFSLSQWEKQKFYIKRLYFSVKGQ